MIRKLCRASKCDQCPPNKAHYCSVCKVEDADHRGRECPLRKRESMEDPRQTRINKNVVLGYHQTSRECFDLIVASGKMKRGQTGMAGGGIYFAEKASDTDHKTTARGVVIKCNVKIGNMKTVDVNGDKSLSFRSLLRFKIFSPFKSQFGTKQSTI